MSYHAYGMEVPDEIIESIQRYVEHGIPTGGFLEAVICNNLREAVGRADHKNILILPAIVSYLYNECPMGCWGTADSFKEWISRKHGERLATKDGWIA